MRIIDLIDKEQIVSSDISLSYKVETIEHNAKNCNENSLFILPNSKKCPKEFKKEPAAVVCDERAELPKGIRSIRIKDARQVTARIYARFYGIHKTALKLIGVTGTNGKTSTASFLKQAYSNAGEKVGFIGTGLISIGNTVVSEQYYSMTTPDPWLLYPTLSKMEESGCSVVIMEISSHALELRKVEPLIFDVGIFTNLSPEHLDFHGDEESYYQAKKKLFSQCRTAVINIDDPHGRRLVRETECEKITAGILWRGDVYVSDIKSYGFDGIEYLYHGKSYSFAMKLRTAGIYNVYNSMLAIAAATHLGLKPCRVKQALSTLPTINGRYEIIKDEITVIIDYAHTDTALENVLKNLVEAKEKRQKLTVIFGCGGERDRSKRARMAKAAERYADFTVVTSDNSRGEDPDTIISDIVKGFDTLSYKIIKDRKIAIIDTLLSLDTGDIVAIIGKGAEKYNIDRGGYHSFDEKAIVSEVLKLRKEKKDNENKA